MKKAIVALVVASAFTLGAAGSAFALNSTTAGASSWTSSYGGLANGEVHIQDTASGFDVKAEYKRANIGSKYTLYNSHGYGWTVSAGSSTNRVTHLHGCEVIPVIPDNCASWDPSNPF